MILNLFKYKVVCVLVTYDDVNILYSPKCILKYFCQKNK